MNAAILLPGLTSLLAFVFAVALFDQWRERRHAFQLIWAVGMLFYGTAAGCEAIGAAAGWIEPIYKAWYTTGVLTPAWLGLGTMVLLARTRFGYTVAALLFLAGLIMFALRNSPRYAEAGSTPVLFFIVAAVLALSVAVETYFQNERWPYLAAMAVIGATILTFTLAAAAPLPSPGYAVDPRTQVPTGDLIPAHVRLLAVFLNVPGGLALILGAVFSTYVFMPKRRVLSYSLDPNQPGDEFLFNLLISPVAITVNFIASVPGAVRALLSGRMHSRVPATILIAIGAFFPTITNFLNRLGSTELFQLGNFLGLVLIFAGFLVSIEVFREIRVPFTGIRLRTGRVERGHEHSTQ